MDLAVALYLELDIIAVMVLVIVMDHDWLDTMPLDRKLFNIELYVLSVVLVTDAFSWFFNNSVFESARTLAVIFKNINWGLTIIPSFVGFLYCSVIVYERIRRKDIVFAIIPVLISTVLLIMNTSNKWIFEIDANNVYTRGPYFFIVAGLPFVHMLYANIITATAYVRSKSSDRSKYLMITLYMTVPFVAAIVQIIVSGILTIWISLTLSMLMCYVYIQKGNVLMDPLTGLNNRRRFDDYAKLHFRNASPEDMIYIVVLDIDDFKRINDTYGHNEGDRALLRASSVLKKVMSDEHGLLARIGGDEFAIISSGSNEDEVVNLIKKINSAMEESNHNSISEYSIVFSAGFAGVKGMAKIDYHKLFASADKKMYEQKNRT